MLIALEVLAIFIAIILWVMIVVNMFRKNIWWGFLGLLTFIPAYYHVVRYYTGNRKVVAPLFIMTSLLPIMHGLYANIKGEQQLKPFINDVSKNLKMELRYSGNVQITPSANKYFVWCVPSDINKVEFKSVEEMIDKYKKTFIEPMIPYYNSNIKNPSETAIKIGIESPYKMVGCFEVSQSGITKSWATSLEEPCDDQSAEPAPAGVR